MIRSTGVGEGLLKCVDEEGRTKEVAVKGVLYVPELNCGVLSVRKLTKKGLKVAVPGYECQRKSGSRRGA